MVDAPTGLRNKLNPFFARVNHAKLARVDKNKTEFFGTIGGVGGGTLPPPLPTGTHDLTIGNGSGTYGYLNGVYGDISPTTLREGTIALLQIPANNTLRIAFDGDVKLSNCDVILASYAEGVVEIPLVWNSSLNTYVSAASQEIRDWFEAKDGETVKINLLPVVYDLPFDDTFVPGIITADTVSGFDTATAAGTPPNPLPTFGGGDVPTRLWLQANKSTGRIDLAPTGVSDFRMRGSDNVPAAAIIMQFDDEPTFFLTESGGIRYRNGSAVVPATYLYGKIGTPVRLRITKAP